MVENKDINVVVETEEVVIPIETIGIQGPKGDTALSVEVGTTTTCEAGANASVTNSGTTTDLILNFTIPKGPKGDEGVGVPAGGTTGQILKKKSSNDYDTEWGDGSSGDEKITSSSSTDNQYPSAKCVYDLIGNVETILTTLTTGNGV